MEESILAQELKSDNKLPLYLSQGLYIDAKNLKKEQIKVLISREYQTNQYHRKKLHKPLIKNETGY